MNIAELLSDDDGEREDKTPAHILYARAIYPYPLNTGGPQLLPGRSRRCGFWVSALVPDGTAYLVDTNQLLPGGSWTHNPAQDAIPEDAVLVLINPKYEDQIRKAMATWKAVLRMEPEERQRLERDIARRMQAQLEAMLFSAPAGHAFTCFPLEREEQPFIFYRPKS